MKMDLAEKKDENNQNFENITFFKNENKIDLK